MTNYLNSEIPSQYDIHEHFTNNEKKVLIGGIVSKGSIMLGNKYYLGPDKIGTYKIVEIEGIHCKKIPSKIVYEGQFATLSLNGKI